MLNNYVIKYQTSPSARKVWIEIPLPYLPFIMSFGHLPRGRCGLKFCCRHKIAIICASPSARKVWIEMVNYVIYFGLNIVTFREEGVD